FAAQQRDVAVIARALDYAAGAQVVDAAVADMGPVRGRVLHETERASRARLVPDRDVAAERCDPRMREGERMREKSLRVQNLYSLCHEKLGDGRHSDLSG